MKGRFLCVSVFLSFKGEKWNWKQSLDSDSITMIWDKVVLSKYLTACIEYLPPLNMFNRELQVHNFSYN